MSEMLEVMDHVCSGCETGACHRCPLAFFMEEIERRFVEETERRSV